MPAEVARDLRDAKDVRDVKVTRDVRDAKDVRNVKDARVRLFLALGDNELWPPGISRWKCAE